MKERFRDPHQAIEKDAQAFMAELKARGLVED
jgi:hypothetical protein